MGKPVANLRLFVAIHPPPKIAHAMLDALDGLTLPPHKTTALDQVHMTVQFIGDTPARELDQTIESFTRAASGLSSFSLAPQRLITLPERGPARLIAMETESHPTLMELHRRLALRLARNVRERQRERFLPHFTVCRFRSPTPGVRVDHPVDIQAFDVSEIRLMRSTLDPAGAIHHEVAACRLE